MQLHELSYRMKLREEQHRMMRNCKLMVLAAIVLMTIIMGIAMVLQSLYYQEMLSAQAGTYRVQLSNLATEYETQIDQLRTEYEATISDQEEQITALSATNEQRRADSAELFELGRKYWYVFRDAPDNSGLTMDDFVLVDDLCKEDNMNPHIMWSIYDLESGYTAEIDNSRSSARGLGQVLASTGKSIYENVLGLGEYDHQMAYDTETNILITQELISRNLGSGLWNAIALYSGDRSGGYYNTLLSVASSHGVNILNTEYQ